MSTEAEQPTVAPASDKPIVADENGAPAAVEVSEPVAEITPATTQNGDSKKSKKNGSVKKEPEAPKDPKTDTSQWLDQQHKAAIHKANHFLNNWAVQQAYPEDDASKPAPPKTEFLTRREFLNNFKDGVVLGRLANVLKPGVIETVKEGEDAKSEENQKANIDGFIAFAKEYVPEDQVFSYEDLKKGKQGFPKVFVTLFQLMLKAPEEFGRTGGDFETFFKEIAAIVPPKFWKKFLDNFNNFGSLVQTFVRRPFARSASNGQVAEEAQPEQTGNGVHTNGTNVETAHEENGVSNGNKVEEKKEEAPAVTAN